MKGGTGVHVWEGAVLAPHGEYFARTLCGVWEPPTASDTKGGVEWERLITWSLRNRGQAYGGKFSETRA